MLPPSSQVPVGSEPGILTFGRPCPSEPSQQGHRPHRVLLSELKVRPAFPPPHLSTALCLSPLLGSAIQGQGRCRSLSLQGTLHLLGKESGCVPISRWPWPILGGVYVPLPGVDSGSTRGGASVSRAGAHFGATSKRATQPQKPKAHFTLCCVPGCPQTHHPSCHGFPRSLIYSCVHYIFSAHH